MTKLQIESEIKTISLIEVHMETNSGTFGNSEACRKVGTGDPAVATRNVYEVVGSGQRRATGPDEEDAPGRMRTIGVAEMKEYRVKLAELKKLLRTVK